MSFEIALTPASVLKRDVNYAEVKAIATGNPAIRRKMELEMEVSRLQVLEKQYYASKYNLEDRIAKHYPARIASASELAKNLEHDIRLREENDIGQFYMMLGKNTFTDRKDAGELLLKAVQSGKYADKEIGYYMGFAIIPRKSIFTNSKQGKHKIRVK